MFSVSSIDKSWLDSGQIYERKTEKKERKKEKRRKRKVGVMYYKTVDIESVGMFKHATNECYKI